MLGQLHLSAAFTCTVEGRTDDADAHRAEATQEAATLGDPEDGAGFNQSGFGPTNVGLWRMAVASERGEHGRVIELARAVRPDNLRQVNRHQASWLALGRALAHAGRDREAMTAYLRAERAAPVVFALNPQVRDTIVAMVNRARRRSVSDDLRILPAGSASKPERITGGDKPPSPAPYGACQRGRGGGRTRSSRCWRSGR